MPSHAESIHPSQLGLTLYVPKNSDFKDKSMTTPELAHLLLETGEIKYSYSNEVLSQQQVEEYMKRGDIMLPEAGCILLSSNKFNSVVNGYQPAHNLRNTTPTPSQSTN